MDDQELEQIRMQRLAQMQQQVKQLKDDLLWKFNQETFSGRRTKPRSPAETS